MDAVENGLTSDVDASPGDTPIRGLEGIAVLADGEWAKPYTRAHLNYISQRKNLWYVSMGHLYLYHFLQDEAAFPVSVAATSRPQPSDFHLSQNYPNPFNPATTIDYQLAQTGRVQLGVYNALGQLMETLVEEKQRPGSYSVRWHADGHPAGTYFYRIQVGEVVRQRKMLLLK